MSCYSDGTYYFLPHGGLSDIDHGLGYFSIRKNCLHAIDKPARVNSLGSTWMVNGKLHRLDGPAIDENNGHQEYWVNGKKHREDGPAIIDKNGYQEYWINGKRHRMDGAAIVFASGDKQYYQNGKCSRLDGPAVENNDGYQEYWIKGEKLSLEDFQNKIRPSKKIKLK